MRPEEPRYDGRRSSPLGEILKALGQLEPEIHQGLEELEGTLECFNRPASEQALIIRETAARRGLLSVMVEKDFWVSWTLAVLFDYPSDEPTGFEYLGRSVKMEFGWLTDQRPVGKHAVRSWVAEEFPKQLADFHCELVALELERTFWEKATILHSEHHRERTKPMRDRFSRHYSDMAALARHGVVEHALAGTDLRQCVADWKSRFFAASWARYDLAKPGTFRLVPPEFRLAELEKDYRVMRPMFLTAPPSFASIIEAVRDLENRINRTA